MATGTDGIATRRELNAKYGYTFWTTDLDKCPTKSEIITVSYNTVDYYRRLLVTGAYEDNQLVRYSDCELHSIQVLKTLTINFGLCSVSDGSKFDTSGWTYVENGIYERYYTASIQFYNSSGSVFKTESISIKFQGFAENREWAYINATIPSIDVSFNYGQQIQKIVIPNFNNNYVSTGSIYDLPITMTSNNIISWGPISLEYMGE